MRRSLAMVAALWLAGCATTTVPLQTEYSGTLYPAVTPGQPVRLVVKAVDHEGKPYADDSLILIQYRQMAESAFKKAGYTLPEQAPMEVDVVLRGRTGTGIVNNDSMTARNLAVGIVTLGAGCDEMHHKIDASGQVTVRNGAAAPRTQAIDLNATATSCFSKLNPGWLAGHQKAAVDAYGKAAEEHIGKVLAFAGG